MVNIYEVLQRAVALMQETALNSISPERAGGIMRDTLLALNDLWLQQGSALVISKIYASVAAMEADTAPVSDLTGKPLKPGQIVVIASSDSDNGSVYRYNGTDAPSWSLVGTIGNLTPVDSLDSDSTTLPLAAHQGKVLDGKIGQLGQQVIYDVSANNDGATFASLSALLSSENLSTLIPIAVRCGGMSIRFAQTSDNKYVQYRLMADGFSTTEADWQGVDEEPTAGSDNLVKSGGVYDALFNRVEGNNKLDWSARLLHKYIDYNGVIVDNNSFCVSNAITVKKGDIIYFAQYSTALNWRLTLSIDVCEFDGNNTFIKKTTVLYTSRDGEFLPCEITGDNTAYIRINFQPNDSATDGVVFINEKLPYEPYIGIIYVPIYESKEDAEEIKEYIETISEEISHAVYTIPQTLTDAQKAQARTNIESASDAEVKLLYQQVNDLAGEIQNGRINILMVDLLQSIKASTSTLNTIGPFNIVSSTENSITLSAEDYGNLTSDEYQGLCIEIQTATNYPEYKNAIFRKSENNTLVQIGISVDLSNAVRCSSIHDTLSAGNGIHLSPFGYRSLACTISEMLTMKDCYNYKNYIGGFVSMACKQGQYNTVNIEATDGTVLVEPIRVNAQVAGYFPPESGYSNIGPKWGYIENINENLHGYSGLTKQFIFQQYKDENTQEVSIELPFNFGRKRGYLVIEGNTDNMSFPGTAKLDVIENGVVIWSVTMNSIAQKYVIGIRDWSAFSVKISLLENKVTKAMLSAVCFYEMYDGFEYPNLSGKNIAVLGDSWCVFNDMTTSKHFLGDNNEDCENFGQYPDGTPTEYSAYCALFPKYLAHITGGNVDNWGRGGTTSANWGLVKIDQILAFKDYDYMVIEFFTNDKLSGMSVDTWRRNLQEICRKCIKRGVQPIVIMPCVNQGTGFSFAQWNNYLLQGLYFGLD